jgi:glycosyltransferase involved in cell wall biosynthesis
MRATADPLVSVCVPSYRGASHIAATIDSVLAQSFSDFELVIVDDDSPDETAQVVARYLDPRIRFLRNERNLGAEKNWNRCLQLARGRYFKLLPQDDLLAPDCLARQVDVLAADRKHALALVFCARTVIDVNGRAIMTRGYPSRRGGIIPGRSAIRSCLRRGTNLIGEPGAVLFRTDLARRIGEFDANIAYIVDLDYWFRLLLHGDAYYLRESLASFRVSSGSWSVAIGRKQGADFRNFISRVAANPAFGASAMDVAAGKIMAGLNSMLRLLVYRVVLD